MIYFLQANCSVEYIKEAYEIFMEHFELYQGLCSNEDIVADFDTLVRFGQMSRVDFALRLYSIEKSNEQFARLLNAANAYFDF